jgi:orotidine-5'-phosphate decarboxylase
MNYTEKLKAAAEKFGSIICMGMDPVIEDIPEKNGTIGERIFRFYEKILETTVRAGACPSAVKPNYAFYAQYGIEGIETLARLIALYKDAGFPVILDFKRGDIGTTAAAYAKEAFDFFKADAVTLAPYMGFDSIKPFIDRAPDAGFYILTKTSNKSSADLQDLDSGGSPLFMRMAELIASWNYPGIGSVVGATFPEQLKEINSLFVKSGREIPLLIPGVGSQGGDMKTVLTILREVGDIKIHRINSSGAINYAYKKREGMDYAEAAADEIASLNKQTVL